MCLITQARNACVICHTHLGIGVRLCVSFLKASVLYRWRMNKTYEQKCLLQSALVTCVKVFPFNGCYKLMQVKKKVRKLTHIVTILELCPEFDFL
jgi:hypothetical protein